MRLKILHQTSYRYQAASTGVISILRLTPRNHDGQYIIEWRLDLSAECRLDCHEDAFGNITHTFSVGGPITELNVIVDGEVETQDTHGIIRGTIERFPPSMFLRETPLTAPDAAICEFARAARAATDGNLVAVLHTLLQKLHNEMTFDPEPTHS